MTLATSSPTIKRLLERLPEFRGTFEEERTYWGDAYGPYLAVNDLARWALASDDDALHGRVFQAFEEVYTDQSLRDGNIAIEFFEHVCEARTRAL